MADQTTAPRSTRQAPADGRDPNVKVPPRVRLEAERAEALLRESIGEAPTAEGMTIEDAPPVGDDRVVVQPIQTQQPQPSVAPAPQATPAQQPQPQRTPSENDFNAMKGRFERANADAQRLSEEVSNLRNVIATMQVAPPAPAAPVNPELQASSLLTPQEISDYGPEFLDVVGKKAREIAGAEIAQLRQQVESLSRGMQTTNQMTMEQARSQMLTTLEEKIPNWRDINLDPNFIAWLRLPDAFSGAIRHDLLKAAYDQNNAARVSAFFQGFLTEEAAVAPANNAPPARQGAAPAQKVSLETFAAPGRAKSAATQVPVEKPIITRAQVASFYAEVASGKYRGREEEKNRLEAEIFSATNEGRLR